MYIYSQQMRVSRSPSNNVLKVKEKHQVMFETQSPETGQVMERCIVMVAHTRSKLGHDLVSGGKSILCWHATSVANV